MADDADQPGQPTLVGPTATDHRPGSLHLVVGAPAPQQLDGRTCGPTALTTARMLRDPALADWVRTGATHGRAFPDGVSAQVRLAAYHALVHARTNALVGPGGRLQVPWPRALGTTPWGVCRELEAGAAAPGTRYRTVTVRWATRDRRAELVAALADHLGPGRPGILFVGSAVLPRHVALLVPGPLLEPCFSASERWDAGRSSDDTWWLVTGAPAPACVAKGDANRAIPYPKPPRS